MVPKRCPESTARGDAQSGHAAGNPRAERLDAVRIETTLPGEQADRALALLGAGHETEARRVYFCEDLRGHIVGAPPLLLSHGVVLRLLRTPEGDEAAV